MIIKTIYHLATIKKICALVVGVSSVAAGSVYSKSTSINSAKVLSDFSFQEKSKNNTNINVKQSKKLTLEPSITLSDLKEHIAAKDIADSPIVKKNLNVNTTLEKTLNHKIKPHSSSWTLPLDETFTSTFSARHFWHEYWHWTSNKALINNYTGFHKKIDGSIEATHPNIIDPTNKSFTQQNLYYDLIYSLLESAEQSNLAIRPDIEVYLNPGSVVKKQKEIYLSVRDFKFSFTVVNLNKSERILLKTLKIPAETERKYTISLKIGKLKHIPVHTNFNFKYHTSWNIHSDQKEVFHINIEEIYPKYINTTEEQSGINLIYFSSQNHFQAISERDSFPPEANLGYYNQATYSDFEREISGDLKNIKKEDIKKDIERWYGSHHVSLMSTAIQDLKQTLTILTKDLDENSTGKKMSILRKIFTIPSFRQNIITSARLPEWLTILITELIDSFEAKETGHLEIEAFFWSFLSEVEEFQKNIKVSIEWINEPKVEPRNTSTNNPYPLVSYKFKQKYAFQKDIKFTFKGAWDSQNNKTVAYTSPTTGTSTTSPPTNFDLPSKINNPDQVFKQLIAFIGGNQTSNFYTDLFKDAKDFIGWNEIKIPKSNYIETTYEAKKSHIDIAVLNKTDFFDYSVGEVIFGWKAFNTEITQDMSHFFSVFAQLFNKFECYKKTGGDAFKTTELANFDNLKNSIKKNPFTQVTHIINSFFGVGYGSDKSTNTLSGCNDTTNSQTTKTTNDDGTPNLNHPWSLFFSTLFQKNFLLKNRQMLFGYPQIIYQLPDNYDEKLTEVLAEKKKALESADKSVLSVPPVSTNTTTTRNNESNITTYYSHRFDELNKKLGLTTNISHPVTIKNSKLRDMAHRTYNSLGMVYPHHPTLIPSVLQYEESLREKMDADPRFNTTNNFTKNSSELKEEIFKFILQNTWLYKRKVADKPNKGKDAITLHPNLLDQTTVSYFNLDVKTALQSVLGMKINTGTLENVALTGLGITVADILGEAMERDMVWICLFLKDLKLINLLNNVFKVFNLKSKILLYHGCWFEN